MPRRNGAKQQAQIGFDEAPLDNPALAQALEDWQAAKDAKKGPVAAFNSINTTVKTLIKQAEIVDGAYRCGGFIITIKEADEKHIEFERSSNKRISIKPAQT